MSNLTLDDYRRVLLWCGWYQKPDFIKYWHLGDLHQYHIDEIYLETHDTTSLLLLDYSVLEKVRADALWAQRFDHALNDLLCQRDADWVRENDMGGSLMLWICRGMPGDAVRAALAAGIVSQPQENRNV